MPNEINENKLKEILDLYKEGFDSWWNHEKDKWIALKWFQDNWNIDADDFAAMLKNSLSKDKSLLESKRNFPRGMIISFAKSFPEETRAMFKDLYDEKKNVLDRIDNFKNQSQQLLEKYQKLGDSASGHYQTEHVISVYLWFMYPKKYYIYRYSDIDHVNNFLGCNYKIVSGHVHENLTNFFNICTQINKAIRSDTELINNFKKHLTDKCFPDSEYTTLTSDIIFFINQEFYKKQKSNEWYPSNFECVLTANDWKELINDKDVFNSISLNIVKKIKNYKEGVTCSQLAKQFGEDKNFYKNNSSALAQRVATAKNLKPYKAEDGHDEWWPILYVGKSVKGSDSGTFAWKLRDELSNALDELGIADVVPDEKHFEGYNVQDFLNEVYMSDSKYDELCELLMRKKNIILQGAPGIGKTYTAKRLAWSIMGKKDENCIEMVQFHQNYCYEDFVMGYKPNENGFELKEGVFYKFCKTAKKHLDKKYFFIIDEINRGNLSKIFGELLMLIENDYRNYEIKLACNDIPFSVPDNVYIIGMMNTADRSLAMIDYALRRRFSFIEIEPGFDSDGFKKYQSGLDNKTFNKVILKIKELNTKIGSSFGKGFYIGHSYFCNLKEKENIEDKLKSIIQYDVIPTLSEYWFDDPDEIERWSNELKGCFND